MMNQKELNHWKVVVMMARAGNQEMLENLESENQWRKENNLPLVEEELDLVPAAQKNEINIYTKEEALERAQKYHVEKDVLWAIDQEDYTPNEAIDEWDLYEEGERPIKREMVKVTFFREWPTAKLWAVVPKEEWEKKIYHSTEEILELIEKQATGQSYHEAIAENEELSKQPWEPLSKLRDALSKDWRELEKEIAAFPIVLPPTHLLCRWEEKISNIMGELHKELEEIHVAPLAKESLQQQLERLVEALNQEDVELSVEPATEEDESMTEEELSEAENNLLYPQDPTVWDETPI